MVIPARDKPAGCDDASVRRMAQDQIQDTVTKEKENSNMNKYAGTQTEKNLQAAFAGESQARNKYTYFASVAKKEGYEQISSLFLNPEVKMVSK